MARPCVFSDQGMRQIDFERPAQAGQWSSEQPIFFVVTEVRPARRYLVANLAGQLSQVDRFMPQSFATGTFSLDRWFRITPDVLTILADGNSQDRRERAEVGRGVRLDSNFSISPSGRTILFEANSHIFSVSVRDLTRADYEAQREGEGRRETLRKADLMARSLQLFAMDADDKFPTKDQFWDSAVSYFLDQGVAKEFFYEFEGGEVKDRQKTALGYIEGPGGRAWVYADGRVEWVKK